MNLLNLFLIFSVDKVPTTTIGESIKESTDDNIEPYYEPYTEDW